eukprot:351645-Chlamydomonas_euryale.AAC.2
MCEQSATNGEQQPPFVFTPLMVALHPHHLRAIPRPNTIPGHDAGGSAATPVAQRSLAGRDPPRSEAGRATGGLKGASILVSGNGPTNQPTDDCKYAFCPFLLGNHPATPLPSKWVHGPQFVLLSQLLPPVGRGMRWYPSWYPSWPYHVPQPPAQLAAHGCDPDAQLRCRRRFAVQMKRSTVVGPNNTGVVDNIRTSAGTFLM